MSHHSGFLKSEDQSQIKDKFRTAPVFFSYDIENGGVTEFLFVQLTHNRLLIGRTRHGAMLVSKYDSLIHLYDTPDGHNDLHLTHGDYIYLLPLLWTMFQQPICIQSLSHADTMLSFPLSGDTNDNCFFDARLNELVRAFHDRNTIEFKITAFLTTPDGHYTRPSWTVVVVKQWSRASVLELPETSYRSIAWHGRHGFCAAITGVGCWTWCEQANDDYVYEKLSLYHMGVPKKSPEIAKLMQIFRELCPVLGQDQNMKIRK